MKKIYIITAHHVTDSFLWVVKYLSSFSSNKVIIHYDLKSNINDLVPLKSINNVYILEDRLNVEWAKFSQVQATIALLEFASQFSFDYLFFISGDDFPLMNDSDTDKFLYNNIGKDFIHYQDSRNNFVDPHLRVYYKYPNFFFSKKPNLINKVLKKLTFPFVKLFLKNNSISTLAEQKIITSYYKGTNWFTLTSSTVTWIVDYIKKYPVLLTSFNRSIFSDEVFFHSLLAMKEDLNLYNNPSMRNNCLRYIDWSTGPDFPRVLDSSDLSKLRGENCFFCRKISSKISQKELNEFKKLIINC